MHYRRTLTLTKNTEHKHYATAFPNVLCSTRDHIILRQVPMITLILSDLYSKHEIVPIVYIVSDQLSSENVLEAVEREDDATTT